MTSKVTRLLAAMREDIILCIVDGRADTIVIGGGWRIVWRTVLNDTQTLLDSIRQEFSKKEPLAYSHSDGFGGAT